MFSTDKQDQWKETNDAKESAALLLYFSYEMAVDFFALSLSPVFMHQQLLHHPYMR